MNIFQLNYFCDMSIRVDKIVKTYGNQVALNEVSFTIGSGEITGFLGPNGAGKSTLMKIITGFILPDSGQVHINEENILSNPEKTKRHIGYLPELNPLYHEMYVREYLKLVAGFYHLKDARESIGRAISLTGLTPESNKKIGALSKGYRQRVGLAQALIHDPDVLILDEPTSGLDPNQLDEIRLLIRTISEQKTVLLSTHIMQEVEALCNRVIIINKGNLVADGKSEEIKKWAKGRGQKVRFSVKEKIDAATLRSFPFIDSVSTVLPNEFILTSSVENDIRPELFHAAVSKNWTIITLAEEAGNLEEIFRELTKS